jgi:aminoglycoside 6-adenylyltransferase
VPSVPALQGSIVRWAEDDPNIIALIKTGSSARDGQGDEFSDLDLEVIAADPGRLQREDAWFRAFGGVWVVLRFDELRFPTRLVVYDGGSKVDYTLAGVERLTEMYQGLDSLYERGYEVLLDREGLTERLPRATGTFPIPAAPSEAEFTFIVEEFWFEATHMPRYLSRGDLWVVKFRDWTMKRDLLRMLEWRAVAGSTEPVDLWHIGTRMREWVDDATWHDLHGVFGRFAEDDAWQALFATTYLFARVSREVAAANGFTYPAGMEDQIQSYLASHAPHSAAGNAEFPLA